MTVIFKIILGVFGFVIIACLIAMTIGFAIDSINPDNDTSIFEPIIRTLEEWKNKFEILGVGTLIGALTFMSPLPLGIKGFALFSEFSGGAYFWMNA